MINLNKHGKRWVAAWALFLMLFYLFITIVAAWKVYEDKVEAQKHHQNRLDAYSQEQGRTWIDPKLLYEDAENPAQKVKVGIYIDHIVDLSTKDTSWTVDFYIWFRWQDKNLHPGETFQVMDGTIISREKTKTLQHGQETYELYRVIAQITKFFNVTRYPRDDHLLTLSIEDSMHPWQRLHYVADKDASDLSSRLKLPGYQVNKTFMVTKPHPYKTSRGDPRLKADHMAVYDQVIYGIEISRPDWGLYFKMFQPLFASVAIAFLVFFMNPAGEGRVGLGIGAFFAAVASSYVTTTELPGVGILTLSDMVNIMGMVTIFLSVFGSVIVMHIAKDEMQIELARLFDRVSLLVFVAGYGIANILIAQVASL
ncbi:MAG: hypothetical protein ACN4GM_05980 [Gammaproteobacteria bacterium]